MSREGDFFNVEIRTFCVSADAFQGFSKAFYYPIQLLSLIRFFEITYSRFPVSVFSVKIAVLGSLKRVTGRMFKISKYFQRSKLKL